jgi:hypothetical protein
VDIRFLDPLPNPQHFTTKFLRLVRLRVAKIRNETLYFVHIGKCGGSSLRTAVRRSWQVQKRFRRLRVIHFSKPPYSANARYLFAVRNPVARSLSAFNYRKQKVLEGHPEKYPGEREALFRYKSFSELAERLAEVGLRGDTARNDFRLIHHLGDESIDYYLRDLLPRIRANQIWGIITVENFSADVKQVLGIEAPHHKNYASKKSQAELHLSELATKNLKSYLSADFEQLRTLCRMGEMAPETVELLISADEPS